MGRRSPGGWLDPVSRGPSTGRAATVRPDAVRKIDGIDISGAVSRTLRMALNASSRQGPQSAAPVLPMVDSVVPMSGTVQAQGPNVGLSLPLVERQMEPLTIGGKVRIT